MILLWYRFLDFIHWPDNDWDDSEIYMSQEAKDALLSAAQKRLDEIAKE